MLTAGAPPDRADGGVKELVTVDQFAQLEAEAVTDGAASISFALTVAGVPSGTAELDITADGLLAERRQKVQFPEGEMRVVETYSSVLIDP
jgi:hypothetical protein